MYDIPHGEVLLHSGLSGALVEYKSAQYIAKDYSSVIVTKICFHELYLKTNNCK